MFSSLVESMPQIIAKSFVWTAVEVNECTFSRKGMWCLCGGGYFSLKITVWPAAGLLISLSPKGSLGGSCGGRGPPVVWSTEALSSHDTWPIAHPVPGFIQSTKGTGRIRGGWNPMGCGYSLDCGHYCLRSVCALPSLAYSSSLAYMAILCSGFWPVVIL